VRVAERVVVPVAAVVSKGLYYLLIRLILKELKKGSKEEGREK